jgi:hypothetical protein
MQQEEFMSGLGKTLSFAAIALLTAGYLVVAPSLASAKGGGGGKGAGSSGKVGKGSGSGSGGSKMGGSSGKSNSGGKSGSSGKSSSGGSANSTAKSDKSTKHADHHDHDHDYAHDHDHDFHHHHHPYAYPVIIGGDIVAGGYVESVDPVVDVAGPAPQFDTPLSVAQPEAADPGPQADPPVAEAQFYTVYFKDKSGSSQTYGRFDASSEGDRLAETQDRLTAAGVAWWTVDANGVQVDTDINQ